MKFLKITKIALLAVASLIFMQAQAGYPDKPIGVMVAYGNGGEKVLQARLETIASL